MREVIQTILADPKFANSKNIAEKLYRDEPILIPASQLASYTPPKYRQMRALAKSRDACGMSDAALFYQQGKFMEDHQDHFEYHGEFSRYFPTYQAMSDQQLRGYFSWRTQVRQGNLPATCLSFVFVYLYELLNQIGVASPLEGFHTLKSFWQNYRQIEPKIDHYVKRWLEDYVVYYNLDKSLLEDSPGMGFDRAALVLLQYASHTPKEVFSALNALSSYNLERSRFYKQYPEDVEAVVSGAFAQLSEYYAKHRKNSLCERFFGKYLTSPCIMFQSAVFYDREKRRDFCYEINDVHKYRCVDGNWSCERFFCYRGKNQQAGALLRAVDVLMRQRYGFPSTLKAGSITKLYQQVIAAQIDQWLEHKRKNALPKIEIDVSKLPAIRDAALHTQSKLIVEEEDFAPPPPPKPAPLPQTETGLTGEQSKLLSCLLYGRPYQPSKGAGASILSLLADGINEALFDRFGDTVILFNGDKPELIEDYIDELKGMIQP